MYLYNTNLFSSSRKVITRDILQEMLMTQGPWNVTPCITRFHNTNTLNYKNDTMFLNLQNTNGKSGPAEN
jgi:hypothetical protein